MDEQGTFPSSWTSDAMVITMELVADEEEGDPALITAIGRETATTLQRDGSTLRPIYTGQRGGPFIVEVVQAVEQVWSNRAAIEEGLNDLSALVTIFSAALPIIKRLCHAHKQQVGKDESLAHPVKISIEIDGALLVVEAADVAQAAAALILAQQFHSAHSKEATKVNPKSQVKVQGRVPRRPPRRRK